MKKLYALLLFLLLALVARCQSIEVGLNLIGTVDHFDESSERLDHTYNPSLFLVIPIKEGFNTKLGVVIIDRLDAFSVGMEAQADWLTAGIDLYIYNQGWNNQNLPNMMGGALSTQAVLRRSKPLSICLGVLGGFDTKRMMYGFKIGLRYNIIVNDKTSR